MGGTNLLPARMDPVEAMHRTATGSPLMFDKAGSAGLFDAVSFSNTQLMDNAEGLRSCSVPPPQAAPSETGALSAGSAATPRAGKAGKDASGRHPRGEYPKPSRERAVVEAVFGRSWPDPGLAGRLGC